MRSTILSIVLLFTLRLFAQDSVRVGFIPSGRQLVPADNETWTGLAIMTLGTVAGGYMLTNFSDDRRNAGYLFLAAGGAGGMSLMLGSGLRNRKHQFASR